MVTTSSSLAAWPGEIDEQSVLLSFTAFVILVMLALMVLPRGICSCGLDLIKDGLR